MAKTTIHKWLIYGSERYTGGVERAIIPACNKAFDKVCYTDRPYEVMERRNRLWNDVKNNPDNPDYCCCKRCLGECGRKR